MSEHTGASQDIITYCINGTSRWAWPMHHARDEYKIIERTSNSIRLTPIKHQLELVKWICIHKIKYLLVFGCCQN